MGDDKVRPMRVELHGVETKYEKGPFKLLEMNTSHELYQGGMQKFTWINFERGNAVAVILYKQDTQEIVLTRQFRAPTLRFQPKASPAALRKDGHLNDGQLDEAVAGMQKPGETLQESASREVWEETGYRVKPGRMEQIAQFYVSPGGTSERIYLFYAVITEDDRDPKRDRVIGGNPDEGENILIRHIPISEFFANENVDTPVDSKVLIASMLVRERLGKHLPDAKKQTAPAGSLRYTLTSRPEFSVIIRSGDMRQIKDVDAWINSENTDMEMDRFIGRSVSALIRYLGAAKDSQDRVVDDTIADALKAKMRGRFTSHIGTVHDTTSGDLKKSHNVKRLFHVAAVTGVTGQGALAKESELAEVTRRALEAVEKRSNSFAVAKCQSALLPMIGTGDAGLLTEVAFPEIVRGIFAYFQGCTTRPYLQSVHVSALKIHDVEESTKILDRHKDFKRVD